MLSFEKFTQYLFLNDVYIIQTYKSTAYILLECIKLKNIPTIFFIISSISEFDSDIPNDMSPIDPYKSECNIPQIHLSDPVINYGYDINSVYRNIDVYDKDIGRAIAQVIRYNKLSSDFSYLCMYSNKIVITTGDKKGIKVYTTSKSTKSWCMYPLITLSRIEELLDKLDMFRVLVNQTLETIPEKCMDVCLKFVNTIPRISNGFTKLRSTITKYDTYLKKLVSTIDDISNTINTNKSRINSSQNPAEIGMLTKNNEQLNNNMLELQSKLVGIETKACNIRSFLERVSYETMLMMNTINSNIDTLEL